MLPGLKLQENRNMYDFFRTLHFVGNYFFN